MGRQSGRHAQVFLLLNWASRLEDFSKFSEMYSNIFNNTTQISVFFSQVFNIIYATTTFPYNWAVRTFLHFSGKITADRPTQIVLQVTVNLSGRFHIKIK